MAKGDKRSFSQCPKNALEIQEMQKCLYAQVVRSLMYAQVCSRLDIAYIVRVLGRYMSNSGMARWKATKRVLRYLQRIKNYMLTYKKLEKLEIIGYSDSNFVGCIDSRKSTSGYIYLLDGGAISWKSTKQALIASSTMVEEYIACYEASNHGNWLKNVIINLKVVQGVERPLKLYCDNQLAVMFANNNQSLTKSKHIDIKYLVVKEGVQNGQLSIEHMGTNSMVVDPLTKAIPA